MGTENGPASEKPAHQVTFAYRFSIAKYEVPQNLYESVMGINPSKWKGKRNSVEMLTFDKAQEFCHSIGKPGFFKQSQFQKNSVNGLS